MSNPFSFDVETFESTEEERGRAARFRPRVGRLPRRPVFRRPRPRPPWRGGGGPGALYPPAGEPAPEPAGAQEPGVPSAPEGSERVRWIQSSLNAVLGLSLPVDGVMGPDTRSAVRTFQQRRGLPADGIVGPDTERALADARRRPPSPPTAPATELDLVPEAFEGAFELDGEEGEADRASPDYVRWVQQALNRLQGAGLVVDGKSTPATREAVRGFQRRHRLGVDGIMGSRTEEALIAAGGGRPPLAPPRSCPVPSKAAIDRCQQPGSHTCPAIPNLLCVTSVDEVPFEYPEAIGRADGTGLRAVTRRQRTRTQRFVPGVRDALSGFVANMRRFGMPIEAIITWGSLYCRCITGTNKLSNHSFGDAIDIVGVRWAAVGGPASRTRETIVHNYGDPEQRALLRRIDACLRLSFPMVLDYHHAGHRDHFHCDTQRGKLRPRPLLPSTTKFTQEALSTVTGRAVPLTGRLDAATKGALAALAGDPRVTADRGRLDAALDRLFTRLAAGR